MKRYTCPNTGESFLVDLAPAIGRSMSLKFYKLGTTDPVAMFNVPADLVPAVKVAYRRNSGERILQAAEQCAARLAA